MAGGIYETSTLLEVSEFVRNPTPPFWLSMFTRTIAFETEDILFDKVDRDYRRLAPFVAPNVQGRATAMTGFSSLSFRPAYVKLKDPVDPGMVIPRQAGEAPATGSLTLEQRKAAVIAEILRQHDARMNNRNEWLAARALIDGAVTISGEDYPTSVVNFQRHASLTYTLTGTARWSQSTGNPLADLRAARMNSNARSGARITRWVFGGDAWGMFETRVDLKALMDRNFGGIDANVQRLRDGYDGQEYMGTISGSLGGGRMELWVDTSKYVDETGTEQFYLDQKTVWGGADMDNVRCFGAIRDFGALKAVERFQKMWRNEDPSVEYILSQSSPLMVPKKPNATTKIIVD